MFLENLSEHVLQILAKNNYSYEAAAELCGMSPRHFGNIVRLRTVPSVRMLEKLCTGLKCTPNALLLPYESFAALETLCSTVEVMRMVRCADGNVSRSVCPGCRLELNSGEAPPCSRCPNKPEFLSGTSILITPCRDNL